MPKRKLMMLHLFALIFCGLAREGGREGWDGRGERREGEGNGGRARGTEGGRREKEARE